MLNIFITLVKKKRRRSLNGQSNEHVYAQKGKDNSANLTLSLHSLLGKYYHRRNGHWSNYYFNKLHILINMKNNNDNTDTHSNQTNKQECFIQGIKLAIFLFNYNQLSKNL